MSGDCGSCTLCCTLIKVEFGAPGENDKPAFTRCQHIEGGGCSIYEARPHGCRVYRCMWLQSQDRPGREKMPAHMRPDRTGIVIDANTKGNLTVHCSTEAAWTRDPMRARLLEWVRRGITVIIKAPSGAVALLTRTGDLEPLRWFGIDPKTNENLYRRENV